MSLLESLLKSEENCEDKDEEMNEDDDDEIKEDHAKDANKKFNTLSYPKDNYWALKF